MNLRQIEVFRAVMQAGSVTGAARLLNVSQPGISRMLSHIELQTGLRLFERGRGRLQPTPEARALQAEVDQIYKGVGRIGEVVQSLRQGGGLSLRVLASPGAGLALVPQALALLTRYYPAMQAYMETQLVREMEGQLLRQEADVAIATLPIDHALLASEPVGAWSLACVFPPGHPFEQQQALSMEVILAEPLIAFSADTPQGHFVSEWCRRYGVCARSRIEVRSGQVACSLAAAGAGVAVVDHLTAQAVSGARLAFRPLLRGPSFPAYAVWPASVPLSAVARDFIDRVRQGFEAGEALPA